MTANIRWTPLAQEDLIDLYRLLADDRPIAADRLFDRIERRISLLAFQPKSGVSRHDIRVGLRMIVVAPYLIMYETDPNHDTATIEAIIIVRIVHSRRDLSEVFD